MCCGEARKKQTPGSLVGPRGLVLLEGFVELNLSQALDSGYIWSIRSGIGDWTLVAHAYNPSYSGDRDQEDGSLKPAQANSL
jgi:hypothetical protein